MKLQAAPTFSTDCTSDDFINYIVIVQDNTGDTLFNGTIFPSESCNSSHCSTSFSSSEQSCRVIIRAVNQFGVSENATMMIIGEMHGL